jgi:trimethylamine--corrinoid protein Co-methyltransferase
MLEFLEFGQPIAVGPMAMASGTSPATLAGTLAQENAEILAGIITVQAVAPGTPVTYGGIPHIMDPRTSICSFGSPEQGLLAAAMAQMGRSYELPVYININLTDAKVLDAQSGMEKMGSLMIGMLAGADLIGHGGIVGTDHGGSLIWLVIDNEAVSYIKRVLRGFEINEENLADTIISEIGPGGNFLAHEHTVKHFRKELWLPSNRWIRDNFDNWVTTGGASMQDRAVDHVHQILNQSPVEKIEPPLMREINRIVETAKKELVE